jgi:hypothetical protein
MTEYYCECCNFKPKSQTQEAFDKHNKTKTHITKFKKMQETSTQQPKQQPKQQSTKQQSLTPRQKAKLKTKEDRQTEIDEAKIDPFSDKLLKKFLPESFIPDTVNENTFTNNRTYVNTSGTNLEDLSQEQIQGLIQESEDGDGKAKLTPIENLDPQQAEVVKQLMFKSLSERIHKKERAVYNRTANSIAIYNPAWIRERIPLKKLSLENKKYLSQFNKIPGRKKFIFTSDYLPDINSYAHNVNVATETDYEEFKNIVDTVNIIMEDPTNTELKGEEHRYIKLLKKRLGYPTVIQWPGYIIDENDVIIKREDSKYVGKEYEEHIRRTILNTYTDYFKLEEYELLKNFYDEICDTSSYFGELHNAYGPYIRTDLEEILNNSSLYNLVSLQTIENFKYSLRDSCCPIIEDIKEKISYIVYNFKGTSKEYRAKLCDVIDLFAKEYKDIINGYNPMEKMDTIHRKYNMFQP